MSIPAQLFLTFLVLLTIIAVLVKINNYSSAPLSEFTKIFLGWVVIINLLGIVISAIAWIRI